MSHPWLSKLASKLLHEELPGDRAHSRLAAYKRPRADESRSSERPFKESSVLILLYPNEKEQLQTVLIQRPSYRGVHSSQIAFPGGKKEEGDADLQETALREAEEEVGIDAAEVELLGSLTPISIPPSGYIVTPYLGTVKARPSFQREEQEVDAILEASVQAFIGTHVIEEHRVKAGAQGILMNVPAYSLNGMTIWGATAMMISELAMLLEENQA